VTATATTSTSLDDVTARAEALARARGQLAALVGALNEGIEALKADHMPGIRTAIEQASTAWTTLEAEIRANPGLFVKPRTVSAHGIKFGLQKGAGTLVVPDPEKTLKLIRKHLPEQAEVLIVTKEVPSKDALMNLPANDLARIGARIDGTGDQVVIRPADGAVDKIVKALLKASIDEAKDGTE
jgi:hypothetical protein